MRYLGSTYLPNNLPFIKDDKAGGGFKSVRFLYTVDGDTANFIVDGKDVRVRFFAVDTPELHPSVQPYAKDAKEYTNNILKFAKKIYLQTDFNDSLYDNTEAKRLLAWIWVDNRLLNYLLVENGYAEIKYVYSDKLFYLEDLYKAESIAKLKKRRIHEVKEIA